MKIGFFEVQPWEEPTLRQNFPDALFSTQRLTTEIAKSCQDVEVISTFLYSTITKEVIDALPNLKYITTRSTGFDHIDTQYTKTKNIAVSNVPEYGSRTVAEHTFALILTLTRKIYQSINQAKRFDFDHNNIRGMDLYGKTIGLIGLGKIGKEVLKIAKGFGMYVLVHARTPDEEYAKQMDFRYVPLETLLKESHIISLHLAYSKDTHHTINKENIELFRKGSYLINTARGGLVDNEALVLGLQKNILEGVAIDVLEEEKELTDEIAILTSQYKESIDLKTLVLDHILLNHQRVIITPHNAFNSEEALMRIVSTTIENIRAFQNGQVLHAV